MPALLVTLLPLLAQYGLPAVEAFIKIFSSSTAPSQTDWNTLLQLTQTTARQQMIAVLQAHNIDPNSDQGKALLALVPA